MAVPFDFDSIQDRLITNLRSKESWAQILKTSTSTGITDTYAFEEARFALLAEILLREAKWKLAQNLSSLSSQAFINGYIPKRPIAASGVLKVGLDATYTTPATVPISIPAGTIFSNGERDFTNIQPYVLNIGETSVDVSVIQATPLSTTFNAQGINFEEFTIENSQIDNNTFSLTVNGVAWTNIQDLRQAESGTAQVYQIINEFDFSGISLVFGNNIFGKKLELGDTVVFSYYQTDGSAGNVIGTGAVTEVVSTIFDTDGDKVEVVVTNEDNITGGSDIESIEEIRAKAPAIGQSFNAATTKNSYKALIEDISFVSKAVVWGAVEYNIDQGLAYSTFIPSEENRLRISAFTDSGDQLTTTQQETIISELLDKKAPTDIPLFVEVDFLLLRFTVSASANNRSIPLSQFKQDISNSLSSNYSVFNFEFKQPLYESDYKGFIDSLDNMDHHTTVIDILSNTTFNSAYVADITLPIFPVSASSIEVYVRDNTAVTPAYELIGVDNGSNGFTAEAGYNLTGSTINYTTGAGTLIVVSGLSGAIGNYDIQYIFRPTNLDLIPKQRNQIFRYSQDVITVQYADSASGI